ncbi:cytochrome C assembly family protein [Pinirhizobacter sp.]|jgi:ABC-type uncharacterized transport system permease subunit|uniref:cytochrome C assembly family protein n=1 Tax=Pinirhizobacter sp. TaxID=2950432 RepID=UPI002F3F64D3
MTVTLVALPAIALYLSAALALARPLFGSHAPMGRLAMWLAGMAVILHAWLLLGLHRGTLDLHFFAVLSLVAWVVSAMTIGVNLFRPIAGLGIFIFPLTALFVALDPLTVNFTTLDAFVAPTTAPELKDWQIKLHITFAFLGFSVLSIAAVLAILLAIQERALRRSQFKHWLRALPPLTLAESLLFRMIAVGFALLTLTLLTGVLFVDNLFGQHLVHKTVLSIIAWAIFGALLLGRWRYGWRGSRAVNLTLLGMGMLFLAFIGTKFVLELVLHRTL